MEMNWYYEKNGVAEGPVTESELRELHRNGAITKDSQVCAEGGETWLLYADAFLSEPDHLNPLVPTEIESNTDKPDKSVEATDEAGGSEEPATSINMKKSNFGASLSAFAKAAAHEVNLNSKIALFKTRLENSKQIDLRKAHYALGKKLYESRMFLSMQNEIETLERQIKEKSERPIIEENETKGAMLKRVGKNAAMTAESELLSLKLKHALTKLGELARKTPDQDSFTGTETEVEALYTVESNIRRLEDEMSSLAASRSSLPGIELPTVSGSAKNDASSSPALLHPKMASDESQPTVPKVRDCEDSNAFENVAGIQSACPDGIVEAATDCAIDSPLPPGSSTVAAPILSQGLWDKPRLLPLLFCVIGLGWVLPVILPARIFTGDGVQFFLGMFAIPLFLWSFLVLVRPSRMILTRRFLGTGLVACLFTWIVGLALLFAVQKIGHSQLEHFKMLHGKAALFSLISWVVGWLYQGAFDPNVGMVHRVLGFVFGVGLCEEFVKIIPVMLFLLFLRKSPPQNDEKELRLSKEMVLIGIFSGIGFGIGEAVSCYSPTAGNGMYQSLIARWFALISSHAVWTGIVAQILWMIRDDLRKSSWKKVILIGLGVSMSSGLAHGIYDLICGYWTLAVITSAACIFLFLHLIRECEKLEEGRISPMPVPILEFESWLWKRPMRRFGIAMTYVLVIFGIGSFGWSRDDVQSLVESDSRSTVNSRSEQSTVDLRREKVEIERTFRRCFPNAMYTDLDKNYADGGMVAFVSTMISGGSAMADIDPKYRKELLEWQNLRARMYNYRDLRSQEKRK